MAFRFVTLIVFAILVGMCPAAVDAGRIVITTYSPNASETFKATAYKLVLVHTNPGEYPPQFEYQ